MNIQTPFVSLILGKAGSGKSNLIKYLLKDFQSRNIFKIVLVFSKTAFNDAYSFVPSQWVHTGFNQEAVSNIMNIQANVKSSGREPVPIMLIFDDCLSASLYQSEFFSDLIANRRHYNISIIFASQYLNRQVPTLMRENTDLIFAFKQHSKNSLDGLFNGWGMCFNSYQHFESFMRRLERFQFLMIDTRSYENELKIMMTPEPSLIGEPQVRYISRYPA